MLAVDTNVVVRFLVNDEAAQHLRAIALFRKHDIWLPKTVLLETEWVLRTVFDFTGEEIGSALRNLLGLPNVRCEDGPAVAMALDGLAGGLDFADSLHLSGCQAAGAEEGFATFDTRLVKRASRQWPDIPVRLP
jgi:predicted nucleic-acid-binding protein